METDWKVGELKGYLKKGHKKTPLPGQRHLRPSTFANTN